MSDDTLADDRAALEAEKAKFETERAAFAEQAAAAQQRNPFQGTPLEPFFETLYRQAAPRPMVDVTPPHRKLIRAFWQWRQRR